MSLFGKIITFSLCYFVIFSNYYVVCRISNEKRCVDADCSVPISLATTLLNYNADDARLLSFPRNVKAKVFSKEAGDKPTFWEVEINGKRGYVPKGLLKEEKVFVNKKDVKIIVPTGRDENPKKNVTEENIETSIPEPPNILKTPNLPVANSKGLFSMIGGVSADSVPPSSPDIKPQSSRKYQVYDGTTVFEEHVASNVDSQPAIVSIEKNTHLESNEQKPTDETADVKSINSDKAKKIVIEDNVEHIYSDTNVKTIPEIENKLSSDESQENHRIYTDILDDATTGDQPVVNSGESSKASGESSIINFVSSVTSFISSGIGSNDIEETENNDDKEGSGEESLKEDLGVIQQQNYANEKPPSEDLVKETPEVIEAQNLPEEQTRNEINLSQNKTENVSERLNLQVLVKEYPKYDLTHDNTIESVESNQILDKESLDEDNISTGSGDKSETSLDADRDNNNYTTGTAIENVSINLTSFGKDDVLGNKLEISKETTLSQPTINQPEVFEPDDDTISTPDLKYNKKIIAESTQSDSSNTYNQNHQNQIDSTKSSYKNYIKNGGTTLGSDKADPSLAPKTDKSIDSSTSPESLIKSDTDRVQTENEGTTSGSDKADPSLALTADISIGSRTSPESSNKSDTEGVQRESPFERVVEASNIKPVHEDREIPITENAEIKQRLSENVSNESKMNVPEQVNIETEQQNGIFHTEAESHSKQVHEADSTLPRTTFSYHSLQSPDKRLIYSEGENGMSTQNDEISEKQESVVLGESQTESSVKSQETLISHVSDHFEIPLEAPEKINVEEETENILDSSVPAHSKDTPEANEIENIYETPLQESSEEISTWFSPVLNWFSSFGSSNVESGETSSNDVFPKIEKSDHSSLDNIQDESCLAEGVGEEACQTAPIAKDVTWQDSFYPTDVSATLDLLDKIPLETTIWLIITAVVVLIFSLGHYYIEAHRRDGPLVAVISKLEREVLILKKESCILEDKLLTAQKQLEAWNTNTSENDALIVELKQELEETKATKMELEEQVAVLEKEVESVTESGLEMHRLLSESLSSQDGSQVLLSTVETLREKLEHQEDEILGLSQSLSHKNIEVEELEKKLAHSADVARGLEDKIITITREKEEEALQLKDKHRQLIAQLEEIMETKALDETRVSAEMSKMRLAIEELQKTLAEKDSELEVLKEVVQQLRSTDSNDKMDALFDVVSVQAKLKTAVVERDDFREKFQEEEGARKLLEGHMKKITQEVAQLKNSFETAEKEKIEALTKLQVLSNYFKEKESQLQKELGLQESMWLQKQSDDHTIYEQMRSLREENDKYKLQNESLKKEIVEQESSFKIQVANVEQKAHENWVASRQAERRLKEVQQEAAQLRNRLTMEKNAANYSMDDSKQNISESNGDPSSPPPSLTYPPTTSPPFMLYPMPPPGDFVPPPPLMGSPYPSDSRPPPLGRISSPPLDHRFSPPPPLPFTPYDYPSYGHHSPSPPPPLPSHSHHRNVHKPQPREMSREQKDHVMSNYTPEAEKAIRRNNR